MNNLKISVEELVSELGLVTNEQNQYVLSKENLDHVINTVGQRISSVYEANHRADSGDEDDLMLGGIIDELKEAFKRSTNVKKNKM